MEFCENCGLLLPDGATGCPKCGAPHTPHPAPQAPCYENAAPPHPYYQPEQPQQAPGLTTGGYLLTLLVFLIPLVGLIMMVVWSFTCENPARKSLARAYLIRTLILSVIVFVLVFVLALGFFSMMPYMMTYGW